MKKIKMLALTAAILGGLAIFTACGADLAAPSGFSVDLDNKLSWTAVNGARNYIVQITDEDGKSKEISSKKAYYSLSGLAEGDYEIRVKAIAGNKDDDDSEWSSIFYFHKNYETGCVYSLVNNIEYEITKVGTASGKIIIEDTYRGKPVTRIADSAFKGSRAIEEVVIGKNVKYIGKNAFYNCPNLKSVTIPESVNTIGIKAFQSCSALQSIVIPDAVTTIEASTFAYCRALEELDLGSGVEIIGESAFSDCSKLTDVTIPDSVQYIDNYAFSENDLLKKVTFGKNLEEIGEYAFYNCDSLKTIDFAEKGKLNVINDYAFAEGAVLESVTFPSSLTEIGYASFYNCDALYDVTIPETVKHVRAHAFNATKLYVDAVEAKNEYIYADKWLIGTTIKSTLSTIDKTTFAADTIGIADEAFHSAPLLESVNLGPSIKYLGKNSFYKNPLLYTVTLYDSSIETVGERAFYGCVMLKTVKLKKSDGTSPVTRIDNYAFYGCTALKNSAIGSSSFIPDSVTSIGTYAFKKTGLWDEPDEYGIVYAGNWVVGYNGSSLGAIELKKTVVGISDYAFYDCDSLTAVVGLANAQYIGRAAFYKCTSLERVNLNRDLKTIEPYTFYKCSSLITVSMPSNLQTIGRSAFYKCTSLNKLDFSETELKEIDLYAFYGSYNIEEVQFNEEIETISEYAFYKCSSLKSLALPDSLTTLGARSFANCDFLDVVTFGKGLETIGDRAFQNCASLDKVEIPSNVKAIGKYAFYNCSVVREVIIHEGTTKIGDYAFYGATNLFRVSLPESVTYIGKYAFKGCANLQTIVLHGGIQEVGSHTFYGCNQLTVYVEATELPEKWHNRWNSSYRPVVWGVTLSEDKLQVVSLTITENTFTNVKGETVLSAPKCANETFLGWDTNAEATTVVYQAGEIVALPVGTTIYAVWDNVTEEIPPIVIEPETSEEESSTAA